MSTPGAPEDEDPRAIATANTLADISIRNHVFAWMLMAALIGLGLICYAGVGGVVKGLGVCHVAVGFDISFGKGRTGSPEAMKTYGEEFGFTVSVAEQSHSRAV